MSNSKNQLSSELPIACNLSEEKQISRQIELEEVFKGVQQVNELTDGYEFSFPESEEWTARLVEFISTERKCCPFFTFELAFEPNQGPILLRLRGGDGVKEFIKGMIPS